MAVPYTFANATVSIPLSQLDSNFATAITLGNTAVQLGNTVTTLNNMTLANVTVSSGNATFTTANVTNMSSSNVTITGGTIANVTISGSGSNITATNINASNVTVSTDLTLSGGTANGVAYLNGSKILTTGSALTFDGSTLTATRASSGYVGYFKADGNAALMLERTTAGTPGTFSINCTNDGNSYIDTSGATGFMIFRPMGTEQMRLTSTGLGIGTSSPSYNLEVSGNSGGLFSLTAATSTSPTFQRFNNGGGNFYIGVDNSSGSAFGQGGYSRIFYSDGAYPFIFSISSAEKMRLDSSGNLGLGVTPSAWGGSYKTLQLPAGSVASYGTGQITLGQNFYDDGVGSYKYANTGDATRYMQSGGSHYWYTAPSGTAGNAISFTQAMTLDASGNLLVGPASQIVSEKLSVTGTTPAVYSLFQQTSGITALYGVDSSGAFSGSYTNHPYIFRTNNTERMRIDSSGNVGIGTSSPSEKLSIYGNTILRSSGGSANDVLGAYKFGNIGNTAINASISCVRGGNSYGQGSLLFNTAIDDNGVVERMRIDSSGNVGIGTSSPSYPLTLGNNKRLGALNTSGAGVNFAILDGSNNLVFGDDSVNSGTLTLQSRGNMLFQVNTAERMRIDSSGNLLLAVTSTTSSGWFQTTSSNLKYAWVDRASAVTGTPSGFFNSAGTLVGSISTNATTTSYLTSSDYRLKENIQPMQNALAVVQQLNPVAYTWKADGSDGQGFIAHELQAVVPDCVTGEKDAVDEEGKPVYQGIDTSFLVATLTKAIQELKAELDATKAEVAALKAK